MPVVVSDFETAGNQAKWLGQTTSTLVAFATPPVQFDTWLNLEAVDSGGGGPKFSNAFVRYDFPEEAQDKSLGSGDLQINMGLRAQNLDYLLGGVAVNVPDANIIFPFSVTGAEQTPNAIFAVIGLQTGLGSNPDANLNAAIVAKLYTENGVVQQVIRNQDKTYTIPSDLIQLNFSVQLRRIGSLVTAVFIEGGVQVASLTNTSSLLGGRIGLASLRGTFDANDTFFDNVIVGFTDLESLDPVRQALTRTAKNLDTQAIFAKSTASETVLDSEYAAKGISKTTELQMLNSFNQVLGTFWLGNHPQEFAFRNLTYKDTIDRMGESYPDDFIVAAGDAFGVESGTISQWLKYWLDELTTQAKFSAWLRVQTPWPEIYLSLGTGAEAYNLLLYLSDIVYSRDESNPESLANLLNKYLKPFVGHSIVPTADGALKLKVPPTSPAYVDTPHALTDADIIDGGIQGVFNDLSTVRNVVEITYQAYEAGGTNELANPSYGVLRQSPIDAIDNTEYGLDTRDNIAPYTNSQGGTVLTTEIPFGAVAVGSSSPVTIDLSVFRERHEYQGLFPPSLNRLNVTDLSRQITLSTEGATETLSIDFAADAFTIPPAVPGFDLKITRLADKFEVEFSNIRYNIVTSYYAYVLLFDATSVGVVPTGEAINVVRADDDSIIECGEKRLPPLDFSELKFVLDDATSTLEQLSDNLLNVVTQPQDKLLVALAPRATGYLLLPEHVGDTLTYAGSSLSSFFGSDNWIITRYLTAADYAAKNFSEGVPNASQFLGPVIELLKWTGTQTYLPVEITGLSATTNTIDVTWSDAQAANLVDYVVEYAKLGEGFQSLAAQTTTSAQITGLDPASRYYVRIRKNIQGGTIVYSATLSIDTEGAFAIQSTTEPNPNDVQVTWADSASQTATNYQLEYSTDNFVTTQTGDLLANTVFTDTIASLADGIYEFRVARTEGTTVTKTAAVTVNVGNFFDATTYGAVLYEFRAEDLAGNDGDAVSTWAANIGTGSFDQATAANQPTLAVVADEKRVRFNSVDEFMQFTNLALAGAGQLTVVIVMKNVLDTTALQYVFETSTDSDVSSGTLSAFVDANLKYGFGAKGSTLPPNLHSFSTSQAADVIFVASNDFAESTDEINLEVNGAAADFRFRNNDTAGASTFATHDAYLGSRAGSTFFFGGDVAHIIIYTDLPNKTNLRTDLGAKYGI